MTGEELDAFARGEHFRAARDARDDVSPAGSASANARRRRSSATASGSRGTSTTRAPGSSAAWRGTPASSPPRRTSPGSARALLNGGELDGVRVLSAKSVQALLAPHDVPGGVRALGWDVRSGYSSNRGDSLSLRAVGHGGYTGTSLWIDPAKDLFVIVLSNRVHPDGRGSVNALAGQIASIAGDAVAPEESAHITCDAPDVPVQNGARRPPGRGIRPPFTARTSASSRTRRGARATALPTSRSYAWPPT